MTNSSETQILIMEAGTTTIGIRMNHILSFIYNEADPSISIRFVGDPNPQIFQGPLAQAILRELRYAGRK
jgi:hypothetical protein